ncbi:branched-chain amino acid ABC transporter permease [Micromonospora sp. WMMD998]|uniref:branched-chain amino acid ABC transporter permease n=1 Tax=Micromonospora sp. WMMD998 TaxID=3016092 RepID=UPI002499EB6E|nr:branched-chain amino acid ABC transporter permease [Micromonospora sp. WMMD998]WFE39408.1 branched-chain amino acid ABC transporter permease [Micromonospora sp. WMMD998]
MRERAARALRPAVAAVVLAGLVAVRSGRRAVGDVRAPRLAVAAAVLAGLVAAPWAVDDYTVALLARTLALGLVAVSVALLTGVAGLPTLGQTAPYAAGAYAGAVAGGQLSDVGPVHLLVAAVAGAALAVVALPLVLPARGVVLLMITLAIGELAVILAGRWTSVTGGTDGLAGIAPTRPWWGLPVLATDRARYLYTLVAVAVLAGLVLLVLRTRVGLLLRAGRADEARLRASGHRVPSHVAGVHIAAGAVAGAAGSLLVTAQQYVSPADFGFDTSALLLLGVVVGGTASVGGALVGAVLVVAARDWLFGALPGQGPLVLGLAFVVAAHLLPTARSARPAARRYRPATPDARPADAERRAVTTGVRA